MDKPIWIENENFIQFFPVQISLLFFGADYAFLRGKLQPIYCSEYGTKTVGGT